MKKRSPPRRPAPKSANPPAAPRKNGGRELREVVLDELQQVLPPAKAEQAADKVAKAALIRIKTHSGPMPPVEVAEGYERLLPGSIDRMFRMAEKDQDAFIKSQAEKQRRDDRFRILALIVGLLGLAGILGMIYVTAAASYENAAIAIAGIGASGIIATLVNAGKPILRRWRKPADDEG